MKAKQYEFPECDTTEEVTAIFNDIENRMANEVNALQTQIDELRSKITKKKKTKKKTKKKGFVSMKTMIGIIVLLFAAISFGAIEWDWEYGSNPDRLDDYMRDPMFGNIETDTITLANGLTIDNATNNKLEINENSDELILTFGSNEVALSSGDVKQVDFGGLFIGMTEISAPSGNPAADTGWLYVKDNSGTTTLYFEDSTGAATSCIAGAGTPAGSDTYIQYNNGGSFGGISSLIWDDTNVELADDVRFAIGTNADWLVSYEEADEDTLVLQTAKTASSGIDNGMLTITVDTGNSGCTANQEVFEIGKGAMDDGDTNFTELFAVDEDGDVTIAGDLTVTGNLIGDVEFGNGGTIDNDTNNEITLNENSEDLGFAFSANTVTLATTTDVATFAFGDVDALTGIGSIAMDQEAASISLTSNGAADDFTVALSGATNSSLIVSSTGTGADALQITTSAGGIDITNGGAASGEDLDLVSSNASINITANEADAAGIVINSAAGGVDISSAATYDIDITATGGKILATASENAANSIYLRANGGTSETIKIHVDLGNGDASLDIDSDAGGIDIDAEKSINIDSDESEADSISINSDGGIDIIAAGAGAGEDIDLNTDASINLVATEDAANAIYLHENGGTSGSINIHADQGASVTEGAASINLLSDDGGISIKSTFDSAKAIQIVADGGTAETIYIQADQSAADNALDIDLDAGGAHLAAAKSIHLATTESESDSVNIDSAGGVDIDISGGGAGEDFAVTTDTSITLIAAEAAADQFKIDAQGTIDGDAINLETSNGGIMLNADGADYGDIEINSADDMAITAAGDLTVTVTGTMSLANAVLTNFGLLTEVVAGTSDTLTAGQSGTIIVYTMTGGACTVTLPEATASEVGVFYILQDGNPTEGSDLTIDPEGTGTINGDAAGNYIKNENNRDGEAVLIYCTAADTWYAMFIGSSTVWTEE